jgi:hypothetical protein
MKFELTIEEIQLILNSLAKLPLEVALATFNKVKSQAEEQLKKTSVEDTETEGA